MTGKPRNARYERKMGTAFVHTVIDDHSRGAYAEIHDDETGHRVGCPPRDVQGRRSAG
ncbi:Beta-glucosidase [Luteimicrobium xylanilyticum]|uniref:Beta-glucosidase n=1 Tax=Luteimicrobium xylanilyticum TaxID=1133546 RepID=A0A5P9QCD7_9MICO|nr:Beta-glucosidase [Luteimicrobium xylanilyticum]